MSNYRICLIPGDGVGPEVVAAACRVLDAVEGCGFDYDAQPAGRRSWEESGDPLPEATIEAAKDADAVLVGAMDVAAMAGVHTHPLRGLRRALEVHTSVRPVRGPWRVGRPDIHLDIVIVREITQGMYSGIEYMVGDDAACAVRLITGEASEKSAAVALELAEQRRGRITAVHKISALRRTERVFLDAVDRVVQQSESVTVASRNVDSCALDLVTRPREFDVILATNAFGDILSDVAAGLVGGIGLAPSGCFGDRWAYFEPSHGTAPGKVDKGTANPLATILSAAMMLRHLGEAGAAAAVERAVDRTLEDGPVTGDLGGTGSCVEVTDAVISGLHP